MMPMTADADTVAGSRVADANDAVHLATSGMLAPFLYATALVATDQLSKLAASSRACGPVICPLHNEALFLGLGRGSGVNAIATGFAGLAVFIVWVHVARRHAAVPSVAVAFVAAGIVANTIDRVTLGFVRDFLLIPGGVVINVADIADVAGLLACVASVMSALLHSPSIPERR